MTIHEDFQHGHKAYRTINGVRCLVALRPTFRPYPAETSADFELRMDRMTAILESDTAAVRSVTTQLKYHNGLIVEAELVVDLHPEPQPILELDAPTGRIAARGGRGGTKRMLAPV